nr:MAG TPA: minor capsid protein [Caudoviricetes sp.]
MADYGHGWTDRRLAVMEKKIAKIYSETLEEAQARLNEILSTFAEEDKKRADMVKAGTLTQKKYVAWRQETLGKKKHLMDMIDTLADDFSNADKIAMKIVSGEALDVYALNANFAAYDIERGTGMNLSWTLYDHSTVERMLRDDPDLLPIPSVDIPLDKRWNKQHINAAITKGLLLGDPIDEIAKRLVTVASMDYNAAVRSARTATTAAECAGRINTYKHAKAMGINLRQKWVATLDGRTRHAHRLLDGQMVEIGEKFEVDGYELEYPGDPSAPGYLIYNCRCTVVSVDKFHDQNAPRASKLGDLSYEDWKAGKEVNSTNKWGTYSGNSQNSIENSEKSGKMNIGIQFFANKGITKQSDRQLEKSISSWKANIDQHLEKVKNPEIYDAGWSSKDERQRTGLINHWKKEIRTSENNINDAEAELEKRRNSKNER